MSESIVQLPDAGVVAIREVAYLTIGQVLTIEVGIAAPLLGFDELGILGDEDFSVGLSVETFCDGSPQKLCVETLCRDSLQKLFVETLHEKSV